MSSVHPPPNPAIAAPSPAATVALAFVLLFTMTPDAAADLRNSHSMPAVSSLMRVFLSSHPRCRRFLHGCHSNGSLSNIRWCSLGALDFNNLEDHHIAFLRTAESRRAAGQALGDLDSFAPVPPAPQPFLNFRHYRGPHPAVTGDREPMAEHTATITSGIMGP